MTPKALVEIVYSLYAAGDIEGALAHFAPDVSHRACPNSAGRHFCGIYDGIDALRQRVAGLNATFAFSHFAPDWILAEGDTVAARVTISGRVRETGAPVQTTATHTFVVRDGRIIDFEEYFDSSYLDSLVAPLTMTASGSPQPQGL